MANGDRKSKELAYLFLVPVGRETGLLKIVSANLDTCLTVSIRRGRRRERSPMI